MKLKFVFFIIIIFIFIVIGLAIIILFLPELFIRKKHKIEIKEGAKKVKKRPDAVKRYQIRYYAVAIIFLLLKVHIILLIPWVLLYAQNENKKLLIFQLIFSLSILLVSYLFVLFSKALNWEE